MRTKNRHLMIAAMLVVAATLTACGADADAPTVSSGTATTEQPGHTTHNDADTEFAQMMILHHLGAVEMAQFAVENASSQEVRELADQIVGAQDPEITLMAGWLEAWGEDRPASAEHDGMDHGGMEMDGLDQSEAMAELESLTGDDVDRRFLELMTAHHRGAVEMSEELLDAGENGEARELAQKIIRDQEAEIVTMGRLLRGL